MADPVSEVQDAVTSDDYVGILEKVLLADFAEVPLAGTEDDWDNGHRHRIDQAQVDSFARC